MSTNTSNGFTMLEMLFSLAIVGVLIAGVANPSFSHTRDKVDVDALMAEYMNSIAMARSHAINENITVTLCRSANGTHCGGSWNEGAILFTDLNENHILDGGDRLISRLAPHLLGGRLNFNSFQNRQYLQIDSRGFTKYQNGNFTFCANDGDATKSRQLIVSVSGRTRYARDSDGDGIVENSRGNPLVCRS